ncbi:MAG: nucleoside-diphosphate sugar epimerase/dehydratase [Prevotellamassilia sp.]|nr:nucleoside-diphosphate sugar epimerase/dehydratase [Prevotellamassilia sp.]
MAKVLTLKKRLFPRRYLSPLLILAIDVFCSMLASTCTLLVFVLMGKWYPTGEFAMWWIGASSVVSLVGFRLMTTYCTIIRHSTLRDFSRILTASILKSFLLVLLVGGAFTLLKLSWRLPLALLIFDVAFTFAALIVVRVLMVIVYDFLKVTTPYDENTLNVLVYGNDEKAASLAMRFKASSTYRIKGFINYAKGSKGFTMNGLYGNNFSTLEDVKTIHEKYDIDAIIFPTQRSASGERERLIVYGMEVGMKFFITPPMDEYGKSRDAERTVIREVKIEDLLGREEIKINMEVIKENFAGKVVMVTGAAGSIGSELCRQLATFGIKQLVMFDNAETPMHNVRLEFEERFPDLKFVPVIGDVRQPQRLDFAFRKYRPQVVFHAAAYKHVPLMEENPCEAVLVNVYGSRNVADYCLKYDVEKMVMVSTDKAVNPTNIMGCTKRLAEIYVQSLGLSMEQGKTPGKTKFVTTRFGNVLGSNGSVIPRFREQIAKGGPITVTHPEITRFFMTIPEACRLVMEAATMTDGNQIFVFDMGASVKIADLAKRMIKLAGLVEGKDINIEYTGLRPGEKLYEEVLSNAENTIPTDHKRIHIAKVREYNYEDACAAVEKLENYSRIVEIPEMVKLMKQVVPEFISKNSIYEQYDKK